MLHEPVARVMREFEHGAAVLKVTAQWVEHNGAIVNVLYIRSADSAVPTDKQVVSQLCIFIVIGASEVIFAYYSGHKLCKLVIFPAVRADYRLRQVIDQIRPNVFNGALDYRRHGTRLAGILLGNIAPMVAAVHSFASVKPCAFGCVCIVVFSEKRIKLFRFFRFGGLRRCRRRKYDIVHFKYPFLFFCIER